MGRLHLQSQRRGLHIHVAGYCHRRLGHDHAEESRWGLLHRRVEWCLLHRVGPVPHPHRQRRLRPQNVDLRGRDLRAGHVRRQRGVEHGRDQQRVDAADGLHALLQHRPVECCRWGARSLGPARSGTSALRPSGVPICAPPPSKKLTARCLHSACSCATIRICAVILRPYRDERRQHRRPLREPRQPAQQASKYASGDPMHSPPAHVNIFAITMPDQLLIRVLHAPPRTSARRI